MGPPSLSAIYLVIMILILIMIASRQIRANQFIQSTLFQENNERRRLFQIESRMNRTD